MNLTPNEVLIIALVALVVLGPKQLPIALRKAGRLLASVREQVGSVKQDIDATLAPEPEPMPHLAGQQDLPGPQDSRGSQDSASPQATAPKQASTDEQPTS